MYAPETTMIWLHAFPIPDSDIIRDQKKNRDSNKQEKTGKVVKR